MQASRKGYSTTPLAASFGEQRRISPPQALVLRQFQGRFAPTAFWRRSGLAAALPCRWSYRRSSAGAGRAAAGRKSHRDPRSFKSASAILKPVRRVPEQLQPLEGVLVLGVGDEDAGGLVLSPGRCAPAGQLVQQESPYRSAFFDDHDHGVGHVHPPLPPRWWTPAAGFSPGRSPPSPVPFRQVSSSRGSSPTVAVGKALFSPAPHTG